jgi:hypothetical protein
MYMYSEKTCPDPTLSTANPTCQTRALTRAAALGSQQLTAQLWRGRLAIERMRYLSACVFARVRVRVWLRNIHAAVSTERWMQPRSLFSAGSAVLYMFFLSFRCDKMPSRRLSSRFYKTILCYIVGNFLLGVWRPEVADYLAATATNTVDELILSRSV